MKKFELVKLKKLLKYEEERRNRVNKLLSNNLIKEFLSLNNLNIDKLEIDDKWMILKEILKDMQITESNGILVCTGSYLITCSICYEETDWEIKEVSFDNPYIRHQTFEDIETGKMNTAYADKYVQEKMREESKYYNLAESSLIDYCHKKYDRYLISEIKDKFIVLNPYNSSKNNNGFKEVQRDFFMSAIESGQPKAKKLVLSKYPQMR